MAKSKTPPRLQPEGRKVKTETGESRVPNYVLDFRSSIPQRLVALAEELREGISKRWTTPGCFLLARGIRCEDSTRIRECLRAERRSLL